MKNTPKSNDMKSWILMAAAVILLAITYVFILPPLFEKNSSAEAGGNAGSDAENESDTAFSVKSIDVSLVLDFSGSMLFPANLYEINDEKIQITDASLNNLSTDEKDTYFIIANQNTSATVYRIEYSDGWYYSDSSYWTYDNVPEQREITDHPLHFGNDEPEYQVYTTDSAYIEGMKTDPFAEESNPGNRLGYLKDSVLSFAEKLKDELSETADVNIAWNAFCKEILRSSDFVSLSDDEKDDHYKNLKEEIRSLHTAAGTSQYAGLANAGRLSWSQNSDDEHKNYVIMITDGYLNESSEVMETAESLKKNGTEIIVIGVNIPDSHAFRESFESIASKDDGKSLIYTCNTIYMLDSVLNQDVYSYITESR